MKCYMLNYEGKWYNKSGAAHLTKWKDNINDGQVFLKPSRVKQIQSWFHSQKNIDSHIIQFTIKEEGVVKREEI